MPFSVGPAGLLVHQADKNLFKGAFPGLQIPVFDSQIPESAKEPGNAGLLLLGIEGVDQFIAILGQLHRFQGQFARDLV